jgi:hypothetical protein
VRLSPGRQVAAAVLRASRLPSLRPVEPEPGAAERFESAAAELLAHGRRPEDIPLVTLLRWLAERDGVLFHGSRRGDLEVLQPIRLTRDASAFGDQQAVFASSDPVWALYFATLRWEGGLRSTRNGSFGLANALYPRWYFFSHSEGAEPDGRFGDGWLYVLGRAGFRREPLLWGVVDAGQWASLAAAKPLVGLPVTAADFPFADRVFPHRPSERPTTTFVRACLRGRVRTRKHP